MKRRNASVLPSLLLLIAFSVLLLVMVYRDPADQALRRGQEAAKQGDLPAAIQQFSRAIDLRPDWGDPYYARSEAYRVTDNLERGLADYQQAVILAPEDALAVNPFLAVYQQRGIDAYNRRDYRQTAADFTVVIGMESDPFDYTYRGIAYGLLGEYEKALDDLTQAIEIGDNPNQPDFNRAIFYSNRALAYSELGRYDEALADIDKAIDFDPQKAEILANRGNFYDEMGEYELAVADYNRTLELNSTLTPTYNYRGMAYLSLRKIDLAQADFNRALEQADLFAYDPTMAPPLAYAGLGKVAAAMGDDEQAIMQFNRALEQATSTIPDHAVARSIAYIGLGNIELIHGNFMAAIKQYDLALGLPAPDPQAYLGRSSAYAEMGDNAQAARDYAAWIASAKIRPQH